MPQGQQTGTCPRRVPPIEILFVDAHIVVANKPSGLLVHRGLDKDDDVAMFRVRDAIGQHVHPLHRLDRGTSGALLFARTREAAATLSGPSRRAASRSVTSRSSVARRPSPAPSTTRFPRTKAARASGR